MGKFWITITILCLVMNWIGEAKAETKSVKNSDGKKAFDIRLEFKNACKIDWAKTDPFDDDKEGKNANKDYHHLRGSTPVAVDGSLKFTFFADEGSTPVFCNYTWTDSLGNDITNKPHPADGKKVSCIGGIATGEGLLAVSVGGISDSFRTTVGDTPAQTLVRFVDFLATFVSDGDTLIDYTWISADTILMEGNHLGDFAAELRAEIVSLDQGQDLHLTLLPQLVVFDPYDGITQYEWVQLEAGIVGQGQGTLDEDGGTGVVTIVRVGPDLAPDQTPTVEVIPGCGECGADCDTLCVPAVNPQLSAWEYDPMDSSFWAVVTFDSAGCVCLTLTDIAFWPPSPVIDLTILPEESGVRLQWTASSGATSYNIYRCDTNPVDPTPENLIGDVTGTTYLDQLPTQIAKRVYVVTAVR